MQPENTTRCIPGSEDWRNAAQMVRDAGYVHPAEVIEALAGEVSDLLAERDALHFAIKGQPKPMGCICPPSAEATCQGALCPRRAIGSAA